MPQVLGGTRVAPASGEPGNLESAKTVDPPTTRIQLYSDFIVEPREVGKVQVAKSRSPTGHTTSSKRSNDSVYLHYELHGRGDEPNKVLLVNGLSETAVGWSTTIKYLLADGSFQICAFDNRGVGESSMDVYNFSVRDMALDALDLLTHLGWTKDVFLMGISMGGMISLELLSNAPKGTFAAAALLSTLPKHVGVPKWRTLLWFARNLFGMCLISSPDEYAIKLTELAFPAHWLNAKCEGPGFATNRDLIDERFTAYARKRPMQTPDAVKAQSFAARYHNIDDQRLREIGNLGIPICIFAGTDDIMVRPFNSYMMAHKIPAHLMMYPGSGHMLNEQIPEIFHQDLFTHFKSSHAYVPARRASEAENVE